MTQSYVLYHTNPNWFNYIFSNNMNVGLINFWTNRNANNPRSKLNIGTGSVFLFKVYGEVAGCGRYIREEDLTIPEMWDKYKRGNGADTVSQLEKMLHTTSINSSINNNTRLRCYILDQAVRFKSTIPLKSIGISPYLVVQYFDVNLSTKLQGQC
jgi:hypothetical protein